MDKIEKIKDLFKDVDTKDRVSIISSGNKFAVIKSGHNRALKLFKFREQAYFYAKTNFKNVVVHNSNGSILFIDYNTNK